MQQIPLNTATAGNRRIVFLAVLEADRVTPLPSQTFSASEIRVSKNGAAEANNAGSVTEIAGGLYYYAATQGETDTRGALILRGAKTGVVICGPDGGPNNFLIAQVGFEGMMDETDGVEPGTTLRAAFRLFRAALVGKSNGAGTGTENFRNTADSKNRITATVDANGNRTAIATDVT